MAGWGQGGVRKTLPAEVKSFESFVECDTFRRHSLDEMTLSRTLLASQLSVSQLNSSQGRGQTETRRRSLCGVS